MRTFVAAVSTGAKAGRLCLTEAGGSDSGRAGRQGLRLPANKNAGVINEMEYKEKVYTDTDRCKGCGLCINFCPKQAITQSAHANAKGYNYVEVDDEKCVRCGACYRVCPDYVFEIR